MSRRTTAAALPSDAMCSCKGPFLLLLDPVSGADRPAREHLRPWLADKGLIEDEIQDVLTAVTEAVAVLVDAERRPETAEPIQISALVDVDARGARGVALRVVGRGTMPIGRGTVSDALDYGQLMMRGAMDEVITEQDPQGGTVIAMRTRPLRRRPGRATAG